MHAELPAAVVSVLQEPGDQLLLGERLQNLNLQRKPQSVINWDQNQQHSLSASNSRDKLAIDPSIPFLSPVQSFREGGAHPSCKSEWSVGHSPALARSLAGLVQPEPVERAERKLHSMTSGKIHIHPSQLSWDRLHLHCNPELHKQKRD